MRNILFVLVLLATVGCTKPKETVRGTAGLELGSPIPASFKGEKDIFTDLIVWDHGDQYAPFNSLCIGLKTNHTIWRIDLTGSDFPPQQVAAILAQLKMKYAYIREEKQPDFKYYVFGDAEHQVVLEILTNIVSLQYVDAPYQKEQMDEVRNKEKLNAAKF